MGPQSRSHLRFRRSSSLRWCPLLRSSSRLPSLSLSVRRRFSGWSSLMRTARLLPVLLRSGSGAGRSLLPDDCSLSPPPAPPDVVLLDLCSLLLSFSDRCFSLDSFGRSSFGFLSLSSFLSFLSLLSFSLPALLSARLSRVLPFLSLASFSLSFEEASRPLSSESRLEDFSSLSFSFSLSFVFKDVFDSFGDSASRAFLERPEADVKVAARPVSEEVLAA